VSIHVPNNNEDVWYKVPGQQGGAGPGKEEDAAPWIHREQHTLYCLEEKQNYLCAARNGGKFLDTRKM